MSSDQKAQAAIAAFNGTESGGRTVTVNEPKPREDRPRGGGGGYGGGKSLSPTRMSQVAQRLQEAAAG